jgi:hypothetical protein
MHENNKGLAQGVLKRVLIAVGLPAGNEKLKNEFFSSFLHNPSPNPLKH